MFKNLRKGLSMALSMMLVAGGLLPGLQGVLVNRAAAVVAQSVKVQMYNPDVKTSVTALKPKIRIVNDGSSIVNLASLKVRYYYTQDTGSVNQATVSVDNTVGISKAYVTTALDTIRPKQNTADTFLEIGFSQGTLAAGATIDLDVTVNKNGPGKGNMYFTQTNDYSFNPRSFQYTDWNFVTATISGTLVWGVVPGSTDAVTSVAVQSYNGDKSLEYTNTIRPNFNIVNTGTTTINLAGLKLRYYFTVDGEVTPQNFWCDWSNIGNSKITGNFIRMSTFKEGADYYLEVGFTSTAGNLAPGGNVIIQVRFAKADWSNYNQQDDYSFNNENQNGIYDDWDLIPAYHYSKKIWGEEPTQPMVNYPLPDALRLQMYTTQDGKQIQTNTIRPYIKLFNTGYNPVNLADVTIRYYFTVDGETPQEFVCDWGEIDRSYVTGKFVKVASSNTSVDYYLEIGFKAGAGTLGYGASKVLQCRFNKVGWANYNQSNDYSFNSTYTNYQDWRKITGYIRGQLAWGDEPSVKPAVPTGLAAVGENQQVKLTWAGDSTATSYIVKRSEVSGGPYTTIATLGNVTQYTDTKLINDKTYYYVVSAKNAAGESADSNEVSATPVDMSVTLLTPRNASGGQMLTFAKDAKVMISAKGYNCDSITAVVKSGKNYQITLPLKGTADPDVFEVEKGYTIPDYGDYEVYVTAKSAKLNKTVTSSSVMFRASETLSGIPGGGDLMYNLETSFTGGNNVDMKRIDGFVYGQYVPFSVTMKVSNAVSNAILNVDLDLQRQSSNSGISLKLNNDGSVDTKKITILIKRSGFSEYSAYSGSFTATVVTGNILAISLPNLNTGDEVKVACIVKTALNPGMLSAGQKGVKDYLKAQGSDYNILFGVSTTAGAAPDKSLKIQLKAPGIAK